MAARCSFRPSASPTSTLARRTPAASDSGLSEFVRSRDRALKTLFSSLARTTKSVSCSLARPDRAARSTDARQRPLLICALPISRSQDPVFLTRSHDEKHVMLTRSSRQGRAIHRRSPTSPSNLFARAIALSRPSLPHSLARRKACHAHSLVQTGPRDPPTLANVRSNLFARAIHRRSRTSRSNKLGLQAKGGHAAGVVLDESGEHPADRRQIHAWPVDRSCQEAAQRVAAGGHPLSLSQRLADEATSP